MKKFKVDKVEIIELSSEHQKLAQQVFDALAHNRKEAIDNEKKLLKIKKNPKSKKGK